MALDEGYCPVIKNYNINVSANTGPVAVGSQSAKINVGHTEELDRYENPDKQTEDPDEGTYEHGGYYQGSYCRKSSQRQSVEREKEWDPRPSKGILIKKGRKMSSAVQYSIDSFLENPDRFIQDMDICAGSAKEQREQFILLEVLPHLEESFGKCSSSNEDVYKILAKISCSRNSGKVVKHALMQLFHLSCKDDFGSTGKDNLLVVEATLRSSIFSPKGMFKNDEHSEQDIKLFVYSRILTLLWMQKVQHEELPTIALEDELKKAQEELKKLKNRKKGVFRYSMELIQSTISYLVQPQSKLMTSKLSGFLDECRKFCENPKMECEDLNIHHTLSERNRSFLMNTRNEWINLHCILIHLHGKVQSKHQFPKLTAARQAMKLITLIVEAYLQGGGGEDWRFCLLASSVLVDIAKNNEAQELREKSRNSLLDLLKDEKLQKKPKCREILERRSSEVLFCPDRETREKLADFLFGDNSLQDIKDTLQTEHLCSAYRIQTLEVNKTIIHQSSGCFVNTGMFQGRKVAVKVATVKRQHLLVEEPKWKARELLIREAYAMMRLNAYQHPNFPVLLGYDTKSLPYHLITEFERWGDLLQVLWVYRERNTQLQLIRLLNMLLNIGCALLYLEELGLIHRCVMAANVLVGDNYVCKLSGLHFIQKLTCGPRPKDSDSTSPYASVDDVDGVPYYVNKSNHEDIPVRWKAPECITEHRYSTASDIWAFGILMYEVLTYGCKPYRDVPNDDEVPSRVVDRKEIVPHESCFEDKEYELIRQCCEWQFNQRLGNMTELNRRLKELLEHADADKLRPDPPPLEMLYHSSSYSDVGDPQHLRESLLGIEELYDDMDHEIKKPEDKVYDASCRATIEGSTVRKYDKEEKTFRERISRESVHHLRGLVGHGNPNLVSILKVDCVNLHSQTFEIISPEGPLGNLKEYVLDRRCEQKDVVTYLSQVASALHYLHINHIVHGDLRAEYVNVESKYKVQVGRLGFSKPLSKSSHEVTSKSCVVSAAMPPDSTRWSAPEVILDGHYTHASDVWSFAILAWELYKSLACGQKNRMFSIPYFQLENDEILPRMRDGRPLRRPQGCPDWVYIIMHQCWTYDSVQRPPVLAIFDCLTRRKPMESWIMRLWLKNHHRSAWPDMSVCQTEDASHILDAKMHPLDEEIKQMTSEGFFAQHRYYYVDSSSAVEKDPTHSLDVYEEVNEEGDTSDRQNGITEEFYGSCASLYSFYGSIEHHDQRTNPSSADVEGLKHEQELCEGISVHLPRSNEESDTGDSDKQRPVSSTPALITGSIERHNQCTKDEQCMVQHQTIPFQLSENNNSGTMISKTLRDQDMEDKLEGNEHSLYEEVVRETRV